MRLWRCSPELHYMVNLTERLTQIKKMVDAGQYFTINQARQYGKTTILKALANFLKEDYVVASRDSLQFFWNAQTSQIYRELQGLEQTTVICQ